MSEENPEINNIIDEQENSDVSDSQITVEDDPEDEPEEAVEDEPEDEPVEDEPEEAEDPVEDEPEEAEDPVEDESGELTGDLKQRIAELDNLRKLSGTWLWYYCEDDKVTFQQKYTSKNVVIDENINYEDILEQLEKIPESVQLWCKGDDLKFNYLKNIKSFTSSQSLLDSKNRIEKIEILEKIFEEIVNYSIGSTDKTSIIEFINNLC
jgi:hypothetical protein